MRRERRLPRQQLKASSLRQMLSLSKVARSLTRASAALASLIGATMAEQSHALLQASTLLARHLAAATSSTKQWFSLGMQAACASRQPELFEDVYEKPSRPN